MNAGAVTVEVHWSRTVSAGSLLGRLTPREADRAAALRTSQARDGIASSLVLARSAVGSWAGVDAGAVELHRRCPACGSRDHGLPSASWRTAPDDLRRRVPPRLSLSRTGGLVVVAMTAGHPLGVDVERAGGVLTGLDGVALASADARPADDGERLRTWVRKEAVLKAAGRGLVVDPRALVLGPATAAPRIEDGPAGVLDRPWSLTDLDPVAGFVGALAVQHAGPVRVELREVPLA